MSLRYRVLLTVLDCRSKKNSTKLAEVAQEGKATKLDVAAQVAAQPQETPLIRKEHDKKTQAIQPKSHKTA